MLNKKVFISKMNELLILFPNWNPDLDQTEVVKAWYSRFQDLTDNEFTSMVNSFIRQDKFNPTVGGLRQYLVKESRKTSDQIEHENMLRENGLK